MEASIRAHVVSLLWCSEIQDNFIVLFCITKFIKNQYDIYCILLYEWKLTHMENEENVEA